MKKNENKQTAFLHIPKTGGTYVRYANPIKPIVNFKFNPCVLDNPNDKDPLSDPALYEGYEGGKLTNIPILFNNIQKYYLFTNVRNIYEWLVSWAGHIGVWKGLHSCEPVYEYATKGFDYFIKSIANREDIWPCRKFIFAQIFSSRGTLVPQWINFNNSLDSDLKALAKQNHLNYKQQARKRDNQNKDYRTYYTDSLASLVLSTWKREIDLFGFGFEKIIESTPVLYKNNFTQKVKYIYNKDELYIDNKLVLR